MKAKKKHLFFKVLIAVFLLVGVGFSAQAMMNRKPPVYPIEIKVDFGPSGKGTHQETIYIEQGTTPKEAVSQVFPILSGKTCCSFREIMEIGGVRVNPAKNWWWTCRVNGSKKISPQKKKLKRGDVVEWKYSEEAQ